MAEREIQRVKEPEAQGATIYDRSYAKAEMERRRANEGKIIIKGTDRPWQQSRQGLLKHYTSHIFSDSFSEGDPCVKYWSVFVHDIRTHSGRHRHQGGLCIYVLEGKGWTVVDGVRQDWKAGDLLLLPVKPEGCEHQHFNAEPGEPCKWLAFIHHSFWDALGNEKEQKEESPDWKKPHG